MRENGPLAGLRLASRAVVEIGSTVRCITGVILDVHDQAHTEENTPMGLSRFAVSDLDGVTQAQPV